MSRCVRPCDACGGVYYDGEPCRFCERLEAAKRWAAAWKAACKQYAWRFGVMHRTEQALLRQVEENAYQRGCDDGRSEICRLLNWARKAKAYMGHDEECSRLGARLDDGSRPECDCGLWDLLDQVDLLDRPDPNPTDLEVTP